MSNVMFFVALIIVGLFFGLVAGIYANKSSLDSWEETAPIASWVFHLIFGVALTMLFALGSKLHFAGVNVWIFTAVLVVFTVLQLINREGRYRRGAWNSLALLTCGLLAFSIAGYMDETEAVAPSPAMILFIIPILLPFIVGAIQSSRVERGIGLKKMELSVGFVKALVGVTAAAVLVVVLVGVSNWAFS